VSSNGSKSMILLLGGTPGQRYLATIVLVAPVSFEAEKEPAHRGMIFELHRCATLGCVISVGDSTREDVTNGKLIPSIFFAFTSSTLGSTHPSVAPAGFFKTVTFVPTQPTTFRTFQM